MHFEGIVPFLSRVLLLAGNVSCVWSIAATAMVWALSRKSPVSAHTRTEIVQLSFPHQTLGLQLPCTNRATAKWNHAKLNTVCREMERSPGLKCSQRWGSGLKSSGMDGRVGWQLVTFQRILVASSWRTAWHLRILRNICSYLLVEKAQHARILKMRRIHQIILLAKCRSIDISLVVEFVETK